MLKIGITGGIGTGKTTVCLVFRKLGIPVYDADTRAKWIISNNRQLMDRIRHHFGEEAYDADAQLDRVYMAKTVFGNREKLDLLNSLVHPAVAQDFSEWAENYADQAPYLLKEAALLYESGSYQQLDKIIVVSAPLEVRIGRILNRDPHRTREDALAIISKQMPDEEKIKRADYVVYNDGEHLLIPQAMEIHKSITGL